MQLPWVSLKLTTFQADLNLWPLVHKSSMLTNGPRRLPVCINRPILCYSCTRLWMAIIQFHLSCLQFFMILFTENPLEPWRQVGGIPGYPPGGESMHHIHCRPTVMFSTRSQTTNTRVHRWMDILTIRSKEYSYSGIWHGLIPWSNMVYHGSSWSYNHGRPWLTMFC